MVAGSEEKASTVDTQEDEDLSQLASDALRQCLKFIILGSSETVS